MSTTNVLVTGANRGLGLGFIKKYLSRPNHIVVGSVRDIAAAKAKGLDKLPTAEGSRLILVKIEAVSTTDPFEAVKDIQSQGLEKLDIVIANSAIIGQEGAVDKVGTEGFPHVLAVNLVAPVTLFAATKPLLDRAENPKWLSVSSAMGAMDGALMTVQHFNISGSYAYGASKAALNHVTRTIHVENDNLIAISIHPGFLETDMGFDSAKMVGLDKPYHAVEANIDLIVEFLSTATKEEHSGGFFNFDGAVHPW